MTEFVFSKPCIIALGWVVDEQLKMDKVEHSFSPFFSSSLSNPSLSAHGKKTNPDTIDQTVEKENNCWFIDRFILRLIGRTEWSTWWVYPGEGALVVNVACKGRMLDCKTEKKEEVVNLTKSFFFHRRADIFFFSYCCTENASSNSERI